MVNYEKESPNLGRKGKTISENQISVNQKHKCLLAMLIGAFTATFGHVFHLNPFSACWPRLHNSYAH